MIQVRPAVVTELPPIEEVDEWLDWSLTNAVSFRYGDLIFIPDVLVAEHVANGVGLPDTIRSEREDGRSVSVYFVLDGLGYGLRPTDER